MFRFKTFFKKILGAVGGHLALRDCFCVLLQMSRLCESQPWAWLQAQGWPEARVFLIMLRTLYYNKLFACCLFEQVAKSEIRNFREGRKEKLTEVRHQCTCLGGETANVFIHWTYCEHFTVSFTCRPLWAEIGSAFTPIHGAQEAGSILMNLVVSDCSLELSCGTEWHLCNTLTHLHETKKDFN